MENPEQQIPATAAWERWLAIAAVVLSAVVLLLTNVSTASAFCSSALVARRSLASAIWVWKFDPLAYRGRICAMFHVSVAFWLGAPAAGLVIGASIFVHKKLGGPLPIDELNIAFVALLCGVVGSALIGLVASISALICCVRVWVHPSFSRMLGDQLTGVGAVHSPSNFGVFVVATSLASVVLPILGTLLLVVQPFPAWMGYMILPTTIAIVVIPCFLLSSRIFASSPAEYLGSHQ